LKRFLKLNPKNSTKPDAIALLWIVAVGLGLRLLCLDLKPLWVDEVITSIFGLGLGFDAIPTEQVIPLAALPLLFQFNAAADCPAIAHHLATQSTHPPLFFCLLHTWLGWLPQASLAVATRSFAVLWGGVGIVALYGLNRVGFSRSAALTGAALMALSPFAVYLSQEARHYTLPMALLTLALTAQVQIHHDLRRKCHRPWLWGLWGMVSCGAIYSHYFCALAVMAQGVTLVLFLGRDRPPITLGQLGRNLLLFALPFGVFLPWLPVLFQHFNSPKTGWLSPPAGLAPLGQTLVGWIVMLFVPPIEGQPRSLQIGLGLLTLVLVGVLIRQTIQGWRRLGPSVTRFTLTSVVAIVVAEYFLLIYGLGKDISIAPRYHFVYFPAVCALLGAVGSVQRVRWRWAWAGVLLASSLCVVFNLALQKPYAPAQVAAQVNGDRAPILVVMAYQNTLEIAVGVSYGLALAATRPPDQAAAFALLSYGEGYDLVWQRLARLAPTELAIAPRALWVIAPGYFDDAFPETVRLRQDQDCQIDPLHFYRIGFPYQRYQCHEISQKSKTSP
jgi:uncharacterized membrane protein